MAQAPVKTGQTGLPARPRGAVVNDNAEQLEQFRDTLFAAYLTVDATRLTSEEQAICTQIEGLLATDGFSWNCAYLVDKLLSRVRRPDTLDMEIRAQLSSLAPLDPDKAALYRAEIENLPPMASGDEGAITARRALLGRILNDMHWKSTQRVTKRGIVAQYTERVVRSGLTLGVLCLLGLVLTDPIQKALSWIDWSYAGLFLAVMGGAIGAGFSILNNSRLDTTRMTIEDLRRDTSAGLLRLRFCIGGLAAAILYFFFQANLLEGVLFPDLQALGFADTVKSPLFSDQLDTALSVIAADAGGKYPGLAQTTLRTELHGALLQQMGDPTKSVNAVIGDQLGRFVPNPELCKLVVWSVLAGFSEKFVKSMLGRIETSTQS